MRAVPSSAPSTTWSFQILSYSVRGPSLVTLMLWRVDSCRADGRSRPATRASMLALEDRDGGELSRGLTMKPRAKFGQSLIILYGRWPMADVVAKGGIGRLR
eukprot:6111397-Prymnesium_polylepis.2